MPCLKMRTAAKYKRNKGERHDKPTNIKRNRTGQLAIRRQERRIPTLKNNCYEPM
jgi:hypothetical protein